MVGSGPLNHPSDWRPAVAALLREQAAPGARLLLAVSGGPDSIALAHFLRSLPYRVFWGHIDHQLRRGSRKDAEFVRKLALRWAIPCRIVKVQASKRRQIDRSTLEEAARDCRY